MAQLTKGGAVFIQLDFTCKKPEPYGCLFPVLFRYYLDPASVRVVYEIYTHCFILVA